MSEHAADGQEHHADHEHAPDESDGLHRVTSPMQEYSMGQVGTGVAVLLVGLVLTFGLAFGLVGL
jgi:hypothetical protein